MITTLTKIGRTLPTPLLITLLSLWEISFHQLKVDGKVDGCIIKGNGPLLSPTGRAEEAVLTGPLYTCGAGGYNMLLSIII